MRLNTDGTAVNSTLEIDLAVVNVAVSKVWYKSVVSYILNVKESKTRLIKIAISKSLHVPC